MTDRRQTQPIDKAHEDDVALYTEVSYFHNGFAKDLDAVVDFYNTQFLLNLSKQEHSDLVAFLRSL